MQYSDNNIANALILFGALQGLLLIAFLWKRRKENRRAYWFFNLFLFSLAYINLWYGLYFMGVQSILNVSISVIPYPYEFLIGAGFFFYIYNQFNGRNKYPKSAYLIFLPAVVYYAFEFHWYLIRLREDSARIYIELDEEGVYLLIEYARFSFNIVLGLLAFRYLRRRSHPRQLSPKQQRQLHWLQRFTSVFIGYSVLSLTLTAVAFLFDRDQRITLILFYVTFLLNTLFIYWIGFVGFTKPTLFFSSSPVTPDSEAMAKRSQIEDRLVDIMEKGQHFSDPEFSLPKLANLVGVSSKELSDHINTVHKSNVSYYINRFRVEKVKALMDSPKSEFFTLEALSQEAGFRSKSSFNLIFKKHTSMTPSQYKKRKT